MFVDVEPYSEIYSFPNVSCFVNVFHKLQKDIKACIRVFLKQEYLINFMLGFEASLCSVYTQFAYYPCIAWLGFHPQSNYLKLASTNWHL